ncbi:hypothetical protein [Nonomuraea sp. SBT364]|uniref:hypothetical protein n=1 Tax=Nonomuraea sp. SBT364 TaxID=1580530 RepID=UPI00066E2C16|nr:hypothetical protein [Nonomuraea sp. SBT364]
MRHILDGVLLGVIGQVNRLMFALSRGRVVLYKFRGVPGILLTVTAPTAPLGRMTDAVCLPDDDSYLVLARPLQEAEFCALLDSSTAVEAMRGPGETAVPAALDKLTDSAERTAVLKRVLSRASMEERAEVRRLGLTPVARLRLHQPFPHSDHSAVAAAIVVEDAEPPSDAR